MFSQPSLPYCGIWASPGYGGDIIVGIFTAGQDLGYKDGWTINNDDSGGPWTQSNPEKIKGALEKYLSRPIPGDSNPKGFVIDCQKDCPCGYFKSSFFMRPDKMGGGDYHFHHYSCRKKVWTEKEGPKNPPGKVEGNPLVDSGGGYLVACFCLKGKERHAPDEL